MRTGTIGNWTWRMVAVVATLLALIADTWVRASCNPFFEYMRQRIVDGL